MTDCLIPTGAATNYLTQKTEFTFFSVVEWICLGTQMFCLPMYLYAACTIYKTASALSFDVGVMLVGALLNLLVIVNQFIYCVNLVAIIYDEATVLILLTFCYLLVSIVKKMDEQHAQKLNSLLPGGY